MTHGKRSVLVKVLLALAAVAVFAWLFRQSLQDTRSGAYTVRAEHLRGWTVALEQPTAANSPLLVLRTSPELAPSLFREVFSRAMESLNAPAAAAMPLVLRGEFDTMLRDRFTPDSLVRAARDAGLEAADYTPVCIVHRRVSEPGLVRQVYLVLFDAPAVVSFRRTIGVDELSLSPIVFVGGAGGEFDSWLPQRVDRARDCQSPVQVAG